MRFYRIEGFVSYDSELYCCNMVVPVLHIHLKTVNFFQQTALYVCVCVCMHLPQRFKLLTHF